jgi:hypothetical protein
VTRRLVAVPLNDLSWCPPGVEPGAFRRALAEDVVDLLATLAEVEPAVACGPRDRALAESLVWPGTRIYELPDLTLPTVLAAATADGYDQAALIAPDVPDLPAMLIGKLLRPLTTRVLAVARALDGPGLIGLASRLPAPAWLPSVDLGAADPAVVRAAAPRLNDVAASPGWHRLLGPADLARLDPDMEGWEATRALLS